MNAAADELSTGDPGLQDGDMIREEEDARAEQEQLAELSSNDANEDNDG